MEKLNKFVEVIVEKTVGRFLPEVEAKAGCYWQNTFACCNYPNSSNSTQHYICNGQVLKTECRSSSSCWA